MMVYITHVLQVDLSCKQQPVQRQRFRIAALIQLMDSYLVLHAYITVRAHIAPYV